jgi:hypothetical protein
MNVRRKEPARRRRHGTRGSIRIRRSLLGAAFGVSRARAWMRRRAKPSLAGAAPARTRARAASKSTSALRTRTEVWRARFGHL